MASERELAVGIAELKARLSHYLKLVQGGRSLTVLDRQRPVARIVPQLAKEPLQVRKATRDPNDVRLPTKSLCDTDAVAILLADRASR